MNKGGIGVGSASIVLVFAVLCLAVFSLISYVVASNDKALVDAEAALVVGFFEADALAEKIVAEILDSDVVPESIHGVSIYQEWDFYTDALIFSFSSPISDVIAIFVRISVFADTFEILSWRMYNSSHWEYDASLNVWLGPELDLFDDGVDFGSGMPWQSDSD